MFLSRIILIAIALPGRADAEECAGTSLLQNKAKRVPSSRHGVSSPEVLPNSSRWKLGPNFSTAQFSTAKVLPSTEIKIIGAGFGRSSSTSVECALARLGYLPSPGSLTFRDFGKFLPAWLDWARGGSFEPCVQQVLQLGYNATTSDQPTGLAWEAFMDRFPAAKVLNIEHPHGVQGFVDSVAETNWKGCFTGQQELMSYFMDCCNFRLNFTDSKRREVCANDYLSTHEKIKRTVPAHKLLTFTAGDGWEPLAKFLGLPVPDGDFPHLHGGKDQDCPWPLDTTMFDLDLLPR